ncbi:PREDICTED: probable sodium/metabolite cotransporter BASS4, chloroplastic [Tarenaya hassleriana]|uniref:probable sodium/metabolite cotransporter BASS4, chloroplastic n=1 Tax=Tarenaya hassleriana TaxID=28532 RepID=UPI00053C4C5C|nr:PREDICTED: probable sodium/metabolite cotransporter BASS4, chloroplastic [Tarenaya hassleriana]XP_010554510.1 PREDICTED: probable sodium/metabolite cotransporter BASS4, chloroplastic [Tarenaya hassleriana]
MSAIANLLVSAPKTPSFRPIDPPYPERTSVVFICRQRSCGGRWISRPIRACLSSDKVGGEGGDHDVRSASTKRLSFGKQLLSIASDNFLPLALVSGVVIGLANPVPGCLADKYSLSKFSTFGIFIISGLTLRSDAVGAAVKSWAVGVFGLFSILFFTPFFSRLIMQIQLQPQELVTGLAIFSCMPTTLSSGVALTHLAGGNSALALAMTLISNLLGILIIPIWISKYIAAGMGVSIPTGQLFRSLIVTLLIPLIIGKVMRESFKGLADFVDGNRKLFSKISAIFLSLVPWMQVSRSRSLLLMVKPAVFLAAVGMGILLHLSLLAFNALSIRIISSVSGGRNSAFSREENVTAVLLVASQKTLPVMVAVVQQLGGAFGEPGLLVLPCVAAHLIQIVMDSFLVSFWLRKYNTSSSVSPKAA